jgi:hypothetical protein
MSSVESLGVDAGFVIQDVGGWESQWWEFGAWGSGCRVQGSGCRVQGAGCRVQGLGCGCRV